MIQKNIHKIFIPQKVFIFLKTQINIEFQDFEHSKMVRAYEYMKISEYPRWGGGYYHSVEQFGSGSGPTFSWVLAGSKLFSKVIIKHFFKCLWQN